MTFLLEHVHLNQTVLLDSFNHFFKAETVIPELLQDSYSTLLVTVKAPTNSEILGFHELWKYGVRVQIVLKKILTVVLICISELLPSKFSFTVLP